MKVKFLKKPIKIIINLILLISFIISFNASAVQCISGCDYIDRTDLTRTLTVSENNANVTLNSTDVNVGSRASLRWNAGGGQTWAKYSGSSIPQAGANPSTWVYQKVDDYISFALRMSNACRVAYVPYNIPVVGSDCEQRIYTNGQETVVTPRTYQTSIRIDRPIITGTYIINIPIGSFGFCQPIGCNSEQAVTSNLYLNVSITVPQTCTVNAGDVVVIDFGTISSGSFTTAGEAAIGITPITRDVGITCDNIDASAALTMRLQADRVSGNAMVSSNPDVGFVVADTGGNILIPNTLSSIIPFLLRDGMANVTIQVYPVSVTGNTPTEGPVISESFLRIDFP